MEQLVEKKELLDSSLADVFSSIVEIVAKVVAAPIQLITVIILAIRRRRYDPEKVICPGCGYRGEKGSNYKTCWVKFIYTTGPELAMIQHSCLRCSAPYFSNLFRPAKGWVGITIQDKAAQVRAAIAKGEL